MRNGSTLIGTLLASAAVIGAGGWMTGHQVAFDGTVLGRCDTYGAWRLDPGATQWVQELVPGTTIAVSDLALQYEPTTLAAPAHPSGSYGTYAAALCYNTPSVRYLTTMGYTLVKKFGAATYTRTTLPQKVNLGANEPCRMYGNPIDVDPANYRVAICAYPDGVHLTTDQGDTWTHISTATLPVPTAGQRSSVRFDRHSAVVGSGASARTQGISIFIPGSGLYETTNGGTTWAHITNRPTNPTDAAHLVIDPATGYRYLSGTQAAADGPLSRWNGGAWLEPTLPGTGVKNIAIDPYNAGYIYAFAIGGGWLLSKDSAATFGTSYAAFNITAADVAWHKQVEGWKGVSEVTFDPTTRRINMTGGIGFWRMTTPETGTPDFSTLSPLIGLSNGEESMVMQPAAIHKDGTRLFVMHDRGGMIVPPRTAGKQFPVRYGPYATGLVHGMMGDFAPEDSNFAAVTHIYNTNDHFSYTEDGGKTWTPCNNLTLATSGRGGGQIAVLSKDVAIVTQLSQYGPYGAASSDKNALYITTNLRSKDGGGVANPTWTKILIGNGNAVMANMTYNTARRTLMKDRYTTGNIRRVVFYTPSDVDNPASADTVACRGFWELLVNMTTGAVTVNRMYSNTLMPMNMDSYAGKLTQVGPGDWMWCASDNGFTPAGGLLRTKDGGASWNAVTGTDDQGAGTTFAEVFAAAAGKGPMNASLMRLWVEGYRMNVPAARTDADLPKRGLWYSDDDGLTWKRYAQFLLGNFDQPMDMIADPYKFGEVDVTYGGTGAIHIGYPFAMNLS